MLGGTARSSAIVMSAVSSVSTPGVLVTVMPRSSAVLTSILSTPLPKLAISLSFSPARTSTLESMRSLTVGTKTSAVFAASINSVCVIGRSSRLSRASNSSRMRVSIASGSLRVTITSGLVAGIVWLQRSRGNWPPQALSRRGQTGKGWTRCGEVARWRQSKKKDRDRDAWM
jgi:hypothetical protein